jgi:hypothetical protein
MGGDADTTGVPTAIGGEASATCAPVVAGALDFTQHAQVATRTAVGQNRLRADGVLRIARGAFPPSPCGERTSGRQDIEFNMKRSLHRTRGTAA